MTPITVIALDDHHLVREGIRSLLATSPEVTLVGEGSAGEHLASLVEAHKPNVVLLDLSMPQRSGQPVRGAGEAFRAFPAISWVRSHYPETNVIVISQYGSRVLVEGALEAGVKGYLLKDDALSVHLVEAIKAVHRGAHYLSAEVSRHLLSPSPSRSVLTPRQRQIIQTVAANPELSYADHARRLSISEHTFSNHLRQIFERLDVNNVTAAVVKAIQLGIVPVSSGEAVVRPVPSE